MLGYEPRFEIRSLARTATRFARSEIRPQRFVANPQLSPGNRGIYAPQPYAVALDSRKIVLG